MEISGPERPEESSYSEQAELVDTLIQRIFALSDKLGLAADDARKLMLTNLASAAGLGVAMLGSLEIVRAQPLEVACRVLRVSKPEYLPHSYAEVLHAAKVSLLAEAECHIGNGLRSVLAGLDHTCRPPRWSDVVQELLLKSGAGMDQRAADALIVPVLLSQAMHASGIHHSSEAFDQLYRVNGTDYEFRHGEPVRTDSWSDIVHALTSALRVIDDILSTDAVRRIEHVAEIHVTGGAV